MSVIQERLSEPRSAGALQQRRVQQEWPADREFRILSIDGGGIRGIFPALVLAELEERFLKGGSLSDRFDLVTGTSTGGIIALGLAAGLKPKQIANLYVERGNKIFPPLPETLWGSLQRKWRDWRNYVFYRYDRMALQALLSEFFGDRVLESASIPLCIPSADGRHGEVYTFKTPHHPDYKKDRAERMVDIACATSAAPTFFRPLDANGYRFLDGGVWANNPIMVGLVDALSCYRVDRHQVRILSVGCGDEPYRVSDSQVRLGGLFSWRLVIEAAMSFQSQNALGQARLLVGAERVLRISPPAMLKPIRLDDWRRAKNELPTLAAQAVLAQGEKIASAFF